MISFINNWSQGIIVSVFITTILEMILPNGSMKKYVSMMIGIYIVLSIVSPVIYLFLKKDITQTIEIQQYQEQISKGEEQMEQNLSNNSTKTIKDIYKSNLEYNIKAYIEQKGYHVKRLYIALKDDENFTIDQIELSVDVNQQKKNQEEKNKKKVQIDDIVISKQTTSNEQAITGEDRNTLKNDLAVTYGIKTQQIKID